VSEIPYERREEYAAFRRTVEADQAQNVTLDNKSPGTAGLGANQSPDDLYDSALQAMGNNNYALAIDLFQRVVKADPKHKGLWNNLGRAYLASNQYGQAVDAFKKQIEINAYDEFAYNNLGLTYEAMQRYDEAIAQFQKQIEINPLDPYAHSSLGLLYSKLKRWNEAVPELEKAVSLQDKNPLLHISLGRLTSPAARLRREWPPSIAPSLCLPILWCGTTSRTRWPSRTCNWIAPANIPMPPSMPSRRNFAT